MRLCALLFCLILPFAALSQTTDQPTGSITVEDSAESDVAIANRIRDILAELEGYDDVSVAVSSGIVTLRGTTLDMAAAARLNELVGRVVGVVAIKNDVHETTDVARRLNPAVERFKARAYQTMAFMPLAVIALGVFFLVVFIGFFLARRQQPWNRLSPNAFIADIYRQIVRLLFIIGGLVIALDIVCDIAQCDHCDATDDPCKDREGARSWPPGPLDKPSGSVQRTDGEPSSAI